MALILACTDGSIYAESIIDHAAWAAGRLGGAGVRVLHVLPRASAEGPVDRSGALGLDRSQELLKELAALDEARGKLALRRGRAILEAAEARLRAAGVQDVTVTQRHGALVDAVLDMEADADLLVIGKRGESADFAAGHLGANLERVLRSSPKPVLVTSRAFRPIRRCAIAYDGGPTSLRMVEFAARSPALADMETHLVTVAPAGGAGAALLEAPAAILERAGRTAIRTLLHGDTEQAIAAHVAAAEIDLLVMGAFGHGRIRTMILGSTTSALLGACKIPVLVFR
jgi:nucleotide-binding universal stress UspA family protein